MDIEQQLRGSLAARDPGADFDVAVMAKLARQQPVRRARNWRVPASLAAAVLVAVCGLQWYVAHQREVHAHEQLLLALQITSFELSQVQQKLVRYDIQEN